MGLLKFEQSDNNNLKSFKIKLSVGLILRSSVRGQVFRSKEKLERKFPGSKVSVDEQKDFASSIFYISGENFPNNAKFQDVLDRCVKKIKYN